MSHIFVDTNVFLDISSDNSNYYEWSKNALVIAHRNSNLVANAIVYAELCAGYVAQHEVDKFIQILKVELLHIPREASFIASVAFKTYKKRGGTRTGVLPDFFIGAHAQVLEIPLVTRDAARYRTYFPELQLIAPHT